MCGAGCGPCAAVRAVCVGMARGCREAENAARVPLRPWKPPRPPRHERGTTHCVCVCAPEQLTASGVSDGPCDALRALRRHEPHPARAALVHRAGRLALPEPVTAYVNADGVRRITD